MVKHEQLSNFIGKHLLRLVSSLILVLISFPPCRVPSVPQVLQDCQERRETQVMPSRSAVRGEIRVTLVSLDPLVCQVLMVALVVTDNLDFLDPKELL